MDASGTPAPPARPTMPSSTVEHLRSMTATSHRAAVSAMDVDAVFTEPTYVECLGRFHGLWAPVEATLQRWSSDQPVLWQVEERARLARQDLLVLGVRAATIDGLARCAVEPPAPGPDGSATALGYAYVLEGSSIGATIIAARVRTELPDVPHSFFSTREPGRWQDFRHAVEALHWTPASQQRAADAANALLDAVTSLVRGDHRG